MTPDLNIALLREGNSAHPWFGRAIMSMDGFIMPSVKDRDVTAPPAAVAGEMWLLVGAGDAGTLWEEQTDVFCLYYPPENVDVRDEWLFIPIKEGQQIWIIDEQVIATRQSASWFTAAAIADASTGDLPTFAGKVDSVIAALEGHRFLKVV